MFTMEAQQAQVLCFQQHLKMILKNRKGAMEMSMGTIVTIVLVVVTLVLALVLIRSIFKSSTSAVDNINSAVQDQINKLFTTEGTNIVIYPADNPLVLSKGGKPSGIGFSVQNPNPDTVQYTWAVKAVSLHNCGSNFTLDEAQSYIATAGGDFSLGGGDQLKPAKLVLFDIPSSAPPCLIDYQLTVQDDTNNKPFAEPDIYIQIQ